MKAKELPTLLDNFVVLVASACRCRWPLKKLISEKGAKALILRMEGKRYRDIGQALGVSTEQARRLVVSSLERMKDAEDIPRFRRVKAIREALRGDDES